jgi:hypothetical protein
MLFKEYTKPLREDGKTFKRKNRKQKSSPQKALKDMTIEELNNLKVTNIKKSENSKVEEEAKRPKIKPLKISKNDFILPKDLPMTYNNPFIITNTLQNSTTPPPPPKNHTKNLPLSPKLSPNYKLSNQISQPLNPRSQPS